MKQLNRDWKNGMKNTLIIVSRLNSLKRLKSGSLYSPRSLSTSALENCETSAIGRALANAGFAAKGKRASREEMAKVNNAEPNQYEKKLQERRYGAPGTKSAAIEDALRSSFAVDNKVDDPQQWSLSEAVDAIGKSTPNPPPECEHGMILKQGVSKGGKPYYGYVCKGSNKDHAIWAKMTANGNWFFQGGE
jgi:hypothetical protein